MGILGYGYERRHAGATFGQAAEKVTTTLESEGFGFLTEIDAVVTRGKRLNVDFRRYVILGACNPNLAHQAFTAEARIDLLLRRNAVVRQAPDGSAVVSIADPRAMVGMVDNLAFAPVAAETDARLRLVIGAVGTREAV